MPISNRMGFNKIISCSVAKSCQTLCDCMDCSMPVFPVLVSWSLFKLMSIESVMLSDDFILCRLLLLLPLLFPSIRIFSNELTLHIRWPKYWNFSISIGPPKEYSGLISFRKLTGLISLQSKGLSSVFSNTTVQKHQFFRSWPSL